MPRAHPRLPTLTAALAVLAAGAAAAQVQPDNEVTAARTASVPASGPIELSVEEAVALTLQNDPELQAERQNPVIAGAFAEVERARFDPTLFAGVSRADEVSQQQFANTNENLDIEQEVTTAEVGVRQFLPTGTELELSLAQDRVESSRAPTQASARGGLTVTQALLQGAGIATNLVALRQARTDVAASAYQLRGFVTALVAEVETLYWDYLGAREAIRILETSLELAERQAEEAQKRIEAGTLARTELAAVRAEAARRRQALIDGRARAQQLEATLLRRIEPRGASFRDRRIKATSPVTTEPGTEPEAPEHVALAVARRAELNEARLQLARDELEVVATRNGLLPRLDLFVTLGQTGYADSFGDAWRRADDSDSYDLSAALEFEYPLGNRAAEAEHRRSRAQVRQAEASIANLRRLVSADVRSAVLEVERAAAQIEATAATLALQEQALSAEQARFEVGRSTSLLVAQAQRDLLQAQLDRSDAFIAYRQALIDLYRLDGTLLTRRLIDAPGEGPPSLPWRDNG